ncbi:hypothetical protein OXX59_005848 [Metschnikowia pulcherrima]
MLLLLSLCALACAFNSSSNASQIYNSSIANSTEFSNISQPFAYTNLEAPTFQYEGVALGGWLLLEPYITPSLFLPFNETSKNSSDIPADEWQYCEKLGREEAAKRLEAHWSTFYNETDFEDIKRYGFNMVRVPIGYWAFDMFDDDPYVAGAQKYLDLAIEWASNNDLKVWIDLHGAPGSQNGFDNSGRFLDNVPGWQNTSANVALTESVLRQIYTKYGSASFSEKYNNTILGIEVLNEPMGPLLSMDDVKSFYNTTYLDSRLFQDTNNTIVFHDAFQGSEYWDDFMNSTGNMPGRLSNYNIMIDHHHYEVFSVGQLRGNISQHISSIKSFAAGIKDEKAHPAVVGEWSAALTDCTPWLNSVAYGTRWEGTHPYNNTPVDVSYIQNCADINNYDSWTEAHRVNTRKFIEIQLDQYESLMQGWIFWCYKTENSIEWDFRRLASLGLFPQPFTNRQYIVNGTDTRPTSAAVAPKGNAFVLILAFSVLMMLFF